MESRVVWEKEWVADVSMGVAAPKKRRGHVVIRYGIAIQYCIRTRLAASHCSQGCPTSVIVSCQVCQARIVQAILVLSHARDIESEKRDNSKPMNG